MKCRIKIGIVLGILCLMAGSVSAQHHIGVRGGYGGGYGRFTYSSLSGIYRYTDSKFLFGWPSGGISWKYYSPTRVVGGIQADLQFVKKGYQAMLDGYVSEEQILYRQFYERTLSAVQLPLMWQPHLYVANRRGRIYANLGVYISYIYKSTYKSGQTEGWVVEEEGTYEMHSVRDNKFEYGLCGGIGFSYLFDRCEVFVEGRYDFGYSDIIKSAAKYPGSVYNRTPVDMLNISAGFYWRLGKGGILAPTAPKERIKMGDWRNMPRPSSESTRPQQQQQPAQQQQQQQLLQ